MIRTPNPLDPPLELLRIFWIFNRYGKAAANSCQYLVALQTTCNLAALVQASDILKRETFRRIVCVQQVNYARNIAIFIELIY